MQSSLRAADEDARGLRDELRRYEDIAERLSGLCGEFGPPASPRGAARKPVLDAPSPPDGRRGGSPKIPA